jgi:hypothetical protein
MATNTLGYYNPAFYANEALIYLTKNLGLASRVHRGFDEERRTFEKGDTINIRRPATFTAQSAPGNAQDLPTESVAMTLGTWKEVRIQLSDKQFAYTQQRVIDEHIGPAAHALGDDVDQSLAALSLTVPHAYVEASQATAATIAGLLQTRKKLFDNRVPLADANNVHFMVGGKEEMDLLALSGFSQHQGAGPLGVETQQTALLGRRYGMNFFANQNRLTQAYADESDWAGTITEPGAKGATTLTIASLGAGSEVVSKGVIIKFTVSGQEYAVTAAATLTTGAGDITINPPLRVAEADNAAFTVQGGTGADFDNVTNNVNVAFHKGWAALAFARLPDYSNMGNGLGLQVMSVQDPVSGIAVRSRIHYLGASSAIEVVLDILYGVKELNADLACRYEIKNT